MSLEEELQARLQGECEEGVEGVLSRQKALGEMSLEEIDEAALAIGREVQRRLTQEMVAGSAGLGQGEKPKCPQCQGEMRQKGYRDRALITRRGEVTVQRVYYYCPECQQGLFPPG